jgi:hypothetical protein
MQPTPEFDKTRWRQTSARPGSSMLKFLTLGHPYFAL